MAFSASMAACHSTIMEDCIDKLSILGRILPVSYQDHSDAKEVGQHTFFILYKRKT